MVKVGDRVMAYGYNGKRYGSGVVIMTQALNGDYCRVRLDGKHNSDMGLNGAGGLEMAFRQDMCKRLVKRKDLTPKQRATLKAKRDALLHSPRR